MLGVELKLTAVGTVPVNDRPTALDWFKEALAAPGWTTLVEVPPVPDCVAVWGLCAPLWEPELELV